MLSHQKNLVAIVRISGNVFCCVVEGQALRIRKVGVSTCKPPNQDAVLELLRPHVKIEGK